MIPLFLLSTWAAALQAVSTQDPKYCLRNEECYIVYYDPLVPGETALASAECRKTTTARAKQTKKDLRCTAVAIKQNQGDVFNASAASSPPASTSTTPLPTSSRPSGGGRFPPPPPPGRDTLPRQPVGLAIRHDQPLGPHLQQAVREQRCTLERGPNFDALNCPGYNPDLRNDALHRDPTSRVPTSNAPGDSPILLYGSVTQDDTPSSGGTGTTPPGSRFGVGNINDADPPLLITAKILEGIDDCLKESLAADLMSLPLSCAMQKARGLKTIMMAFGYVTTSQSLVADLEALRQPGQPLGDVAYDVGKLLCEGYSLHDSIQLKATTPPTSPHPPPPPGQQRLWQGNPPKSALARGMPLVDDHALRAIAQQDNLIIITRDSNPEAMRWLGRGDAVPKPLEVKAKTLKRPATPGPDEHLYEPYYGLASARGLDAPQRDALSQAGYTIRGRDRGELILDRQGNAMYSDTDLHGVYTAAGDDAWSAGFGDRLNNSTLERMIQHGPNDNSPGRNTPGDPSFGPQPPVTAYTPNGVVHLNTMAEMRNFYRAHNLPFDQLYPRPLAEYRAANGKP